MLDGLLGRGGFSSKCKSLIKVTRTRIDVTRRKRTATQKFLKQDIADLLADGLESNAFGRAEGLITEMILSSCYEFVDHVCEIILKHLSTMQKHGECPEECREAVASLMFAAARFSDLPELRDLRNIFQERYGNSLEYCVNQKLVGHISPKPPDMVKKLKLLQDIASEFSVNWDSFAFEQRMIINAAARGEKPANQYSVPQPVDIVHKVENDVPIAKKGFEGSHRMKGRQVLKNEHHARAGIIVQRQNTGKSIQEEELDHNKHRPPICPWPRGNAYDNDTLTFNPGAENLEPVAAAVYYKDDTSGTPRKRSRRRRHKASSIPCAGENAEEVRVVRSRVSTSRRRTESKKGLQILFEDGHGRQHPRDTEEWMMDRLLLHYSKKPLGAGEPPSRSVSLPREQSSSEFNTSCLL